VQESDDDEASDVNEGDIDYLAFQQQHAESEDGEYGNQKEVFDLNMKDDDEEVGWSSLISHRLAAQYT
jgi:hypothetical protein